MNLIPPLAAARPIGDWEELNFFTTKVSRKYLTRKKDVRANSLLRTVDRRYNTNFRSKNSWQSGCTLRSAHQGRAPPKMRVSVTLIILLVFSLSGLPTFAQTEVSATGHPIVEQPDFHIVIPPRDPDSNISIWPTNEPRPPHTRRHSLGKLYWVGWGLSAAFSVADVEMVKRCEHTAGCEFSTIWGSRNPSRLELYAPRVGLITFGMLVTRSWLREDPNDEWSKVAIISNDAIWGASTVVDAAAFLGR